MRAFLVLLLTAAPAAAEFVVVNRCPPFVVVNKCPPPATVVPPRLWTVNTHPGKTFTEDQLRAMYPGHRFPFDQVAAGVAAPDPFVGCGPGGCPTTPTTNVTGAGRPSTSWTGSYPGAVTYIRAGGVVTLGGTSGCASGNCAYPARGR